MFCLVVETDELLENTDFVNFFIGEKTESSIRNSENSKSGW